MSLKPCVVVKPYLLLSEWAITFRPRAQAVTGKTPLWEQCACTTRHGIGLYLFGDNLVPTQFRYPASATTQAQMPSDLCTLLQEQQTPNTQKVIATDSASAKVAVARAVVADPDMEAERKMAALVCSLENKDACLSCGS